VPHLRTLALALAVGAVMGSACLRQPAKRPTSAAATPAVASSCLLLPVAKGTPVAKVGAATITAEHLEARLQNEQAEHRGPQTVDALRDLLDDEVRFELLAQAGIRRQLDRDPEVINAARRVMVRKLLEQDLGPSLADRMAAEATARAYYDKHRNNYLQPEKRRFAQIELPHTAAGKSQAQGLIERMRRHHDLKETFAAMAQKYSRDSTTRSHGGEEAFATVDEVTRGFGSNVASAVFGQDPNDMAKTLVPQPIESPRGWHVVYVLARREALAREFSEVKDAIHARLTTEGREEKFQAYLNDLRKTTPVAIYEAPMSQVVSRWKARAHGQQP
jgi:parvulin-like peptidyl-prolyl isomerase